MDNDDEKTKNEQGKPREALTPSPSVKANVKVETAHIEKPPRNAALLKKPKGRETR